jgi:hypothetical protein
MALNVDPESPLSMLFTDAPHQPRLTGDMLGNFQSLHNLTGGQCGQAFGVSPQTWNNWKTARKEIPLPVQIVLAYFMAYGPLPAKYGEIFKALEGVPVTKRHLTGFRLQGVV